MKCSVNQSNYLSGVGRDAGNVQQLGGFNCYISGSAHSTQDFFFLMILVTSLFHFQQLFSAKFFCSLILQFFSLYIIYNHISCEFIYLVFSRLESCDYIHLLCTNNIDTSLTKPCVFYVLCRIWSSKVEVWIETYRNG